MIIIIVILQQFSRAGSSSSLFNGAALDDNSESDFGDLEDVDKGVEVENLEPTFFTERVSQFSSRAQRM